MDPLNSDPVMAGILASLVAALAFGVWQWTSDEEPEERRATRWAGLAAVVGGSAVGAAEWWLYSVNRPMGLFMVLPSVLLGFLAMWFSARGVYRTLGGGKVQAASVPRVEVEGETLEHQGEIWCQLRDLPQFRETLGGELINLASGDRLYWTNVDGKRCIEIKLAGKTLLTAVRFETLRKYLAVQQGVARLVSG